MAVRTWGELPLGIEVEYRDRKQGSESLQGWRNKVRSTAQSCRYWRPGSIPGTANVGPSVPCLVLDVVRAGMG